MRSGHMSSETPIFVSPNSGSPSDSHEIFIQKKIYRYTMSDIFKIEPENYIL